MPLAAATGSLGVIGGQQDDLHATHHKPPAAEQMAMLDRIHERKTAMLLGVSCELGAMAAGADAATVARLAGGGVALGRAFQIVDDLLDIQATSTELGKTAGKDRDQGKLTWVSLHGEDQARADAASWTQQARQAFAGCAHLCDIADWLLERRR